jgi:tRNA nucleotidyltransferase (CCA-adding enzyme)
MARVVERQLPDTEEVRFAIDIARALKRHNARGLIAGGFVRDDRPHDLDMCATVHPDFLEELVVDGPPHKTVPTGKEYGTITFIRGDAQIEVTTTRADHGHSDNRRDVKPKFSLDPHEGPLLDVSRRDLTINGLLWDPLTSRVIDHVGGLEDLENKVIRFIGDPVERCREDALRVMRFVRFAARFRKQGFRIDPAIFDVVEDPVVCRRLQFLSGERVRDELLGILLTDDAAWALTIMLELGLLEMWFPELYRLHNLEQNVWHSEDVLGHVIMALDRACQMNLDLTDRFAVLVHDLGKGVTQEWKCVAPYYGYSFHGHDLESLNILEQEMLPRLKLYGNVGKYPVNVDKVKLLVKGHMATFSAPNMRMSKRLRHMGVDVFGPEMVERSHNLFLCDTFGRNLWLDYPEDFSSVVERVALIKQKVNAYLSEERSAQAVKDVAINGFVVMQLLDLKPGPIVGQILSYLFDKVTSQELPNEPEALERHILEHRLTLLNLGDM